TYAASDPATTRARTAAPRPAARRTGPARPRPARPRPVPCAPGNSLLAEWGQGGRAAWRAVGEGNPSTCFSPFRVKISATGTIGRETRRGGTGGCNGTLDRARPSPARVRGSTKSGLLAPGQGAVHAQEEGPSARHTHEQSKP